jgi:hypothetical protein
MGFVARDILGEGARRAGLGFGCRCANDRDDQIIELRKGAIQAHLLLAPWQRGGK